MTHFFSVLFEYFGQYTVVLFLISLILFLLLIKQIVDNRNSKKTDRITKKKKETILNLNCKFKKKCFFYNHVKHQWEN